MNFNNESGLHARPASILVEEAQKYKAEVKLFKGDNEADVKSILGLICLKLRHGDEVIIKGEGEDAHKAVDSLGQLMEGKLKLLAYKQDKKAVGEEIDEELSKYNIPNPAQVINMIGRGVKKTMDSLGSDID